MERFTLEALTRLSARPDPAGSKSVWHFSPASLPPAVRERLAHDGVEKPVNISFKYPCETGARFIHRSHALVSILADHLLESALSGESNIAARSGAFESASVSEVTSLFLLRVRHQIRTESRAAQNELMAEESLALAVAGRSNPRFLPLEDVEALLDRHPEANLDRSAITRAVQDSLDWYAKNTELFAHEARKRAETLREDHTRVRAASSISSGKTIVTPASG